jgi:hypothetical protein
VGRKAQHEARDQHDGAAAHQCKHLIYQGQSLIGRRGGDGVIALI